MKLIEQVEGNEIYKEKGTFSGKFIFAIPQEKKNGTFHWFPTQNDAHRFINKQPPFAMDGMIVNIIDKERQNGEV